jgi:hypothetical protein
MIINTEILEDRDGMSEVAREFSIRSLPIYDLVAGEGYDEEDKDEPLCVIRDTGNEFEVTFFPYGPESLRKTIQLEYYEATYLRKLLDYVNRRIEKNEAELEEKNHG